jgi:hypothetical protein
MTSMTNAGYEPCFYARVGSRRKELFFKLSVNLLRLSQLRFWLGFNPYRRRRA